MNIESRVAKLEAENRLLKGTALMALALAVLPWVMGSEAAIQDHVQARRFTLIGNDDTPAGSWSFDPQTKTATLSIQSSAPSPSVVLASSDDHATVRLLNGIRRPRAPFAAPVGKRAARDDGDIALTAGDAGTAINLKDGSITIDQRGKKAFVAPPRAAVRPVTQK